MTVLRGGIDELDVALLGHPGLDSGGDGLSEDNWLLLGTHDLTLDDDEVLLDFTVVRETTHGGDVLVNSVLIAGGVVLDASNLTSTNSVDLLVDLGSGVVTLLTSATDCPLDSRWMPGTDATDLSVTSMSLLHELLAAVSGNDTSGSVTFGNTDAIDALIVVEDLTYGNLLLEVLVGPVDLVSDGSTVELDFENVSLVLSETELADLSGTDDSNAAAELGNSLKVSLDGALAVVSLLESVSVLGESLLLGVHPVLVHSALDIIVEVLGPDSGDSSLSTGCLDVSNHTDDLHWWALNDRDGVNNIFLDELSTLTTLLHLDNMSHTGLVSHEGSHVNGLAPVILREVTNAAVVMAGSSLGQILKGALSGMFVLTMRHMDSYLIMITKVNALKLRQKTACHI